MKEYIDIIFLENFIFTLLIIYQTSIFTKVQTSKIKTLIAGVISAIYSTLSVVFSNTIVDVVIFRILIVNIIVYIAFLPKQISRYLKLLCYFYVISFCYVGVVIFLATIFKLNLTNEVIKILLYIVAYIFTYLCNKHMWKMWKNQIKKDPLIYKVKVILQDNIEFEFDAFVDTGNNLKYLNTGYDVILLDEKFKEKFEKYVDGSYEKVKIPINTINSKDFLHGYIVSNAKIYKKFRSIVLKKVVLVFTDKNLSKNDMYQALISYDTYIEKLQGVML